MWLSKKHRNPWTNLQQLYLLHAVEPGLCVDHLEDLDLLECDGALVLVAHGAVHHAELTLPYLAVDVEVLRRFGSAFKT